MSWCLVEVYHPIRAKQKSFMQNAEQEMVKIRSITLLKNIPTKRFLWYCRRLLPFFQRAFFAL